MTTNDKKQEEAMNDYMERLSSGKVVPSPIPSDEELAELASQETDIVLEQAEEIEHQDADKSVSSTDEEKLESLRAMLKL